MSVIPVLRTSAVIRALRKGGFETARQSGSHIQLRHITDPSRSATVPDHSKDLSRKVLASILRQARIPKAEFLKLLKR